MMIRVLGTGCPKCLKMSENAQRAAEEAGVDFELQKVTDIGEIVAFGVMTTPALMLDEMVVASGRVPGVDEIRLQIQQRVVQ